MSAFEDFEKNGEGSWYSHYGVLESKILPELKELSKKIGVSVIIPRSGSKLVHAFYTKTLKTKPVGVYSQWEHPQFECGKFEDRLTAL